MRNKTRLKVNAAWGKMAVPVFQIGPVHVGDFSTSRSCQYFTVEALKWGVAVHWNAGELVIWNPYRKCMCCSKFNRPKGVDHTSYNIMLRLNETLTVTVEGFLLWTLIEVVKQHLCLTLYCYNTTTQYDSRPVPNQLCPPNKYTFCQVKLVWTNLN